MKNIITENTWRVFNYVYNRNMHADFNFICIINSVKWRTFNNREELFKLQQNYPALKIDDVKIKNPNNPRQLRSAKLITYNLEHL